MTNPFSRIITCIIIFLVINFNPAFTQEQEDGLKETLQELSEDVAREYVSPISSAFGANLNSGWFHKAPKATLLGFTVEFGIVGMASFFPEGARSFVTQGRFRFNEEEAREIVAMAESDISVYIDDEFGYLPTDTKNYIMNEVENYLVEQITAQYQKVQVSGATIIGSPEDSMKINFRQQEIQYNETVTYAGVNYPVNQSFLVPDHTIALPIAGFKDELGDVKWMPMAVPQVKIGTVLGTRATFRFKIPVKNADYNEYIRYFGFGIQHNPSAWIRGSLPFEVALSYFTQTLKIGDVFKVHTKSFGLNLSKQLGVRLLNLTPYIGYMYEDAKMEVSYDYIVETPAGTISESINFELPCDNKSRFTLGLSMRLLVFNINADYNWAAYNSLSAGINFAL